MLPLPRRRPPARGEAGLVTASVTIGLARPLGKILNDSVLLRAGQVVERMGLRPLRPRGLDEDRRRGDGALPRVWKAPGR